MLEAKLVASQIQPLYTGRFPKADLHRLCDENEPIDADMLKNGAHYVIDKNIFRNDHDWGNIFASATEISHYTGLLFPLDISLTGAVRLFINMYDEMSDKYDIIWTEAPEHIKDKYKCPFIPDDPERVVFREKLELVGDPAVFASAEKDSWNVDDVYSYDVFLEKMSDSGFVNGLHEVVVYMDDFGKMAFWLEDGVYHAQIISPVDYTPLLPMLLGGTCLDKSEIRQVIGFVNELYNREGFFLGTLEEKQKHSPI